MTINQTDAKPAVSPIEALTNIRRQQQALHAAASAGVHEGLRSASSPPPSGESAIEYLARVRRLQPRSAPRR